jgi:hypothetical protein
MNPTNQSHSTTNVKMLVDGHHRISGVTTKSDGMWLLAFFPTQRKNPFPEKLSTALVHDNSKKLLLKFEDNSKSLKTYLGSISDPLIPKRLSRMDPLYEEVGPF